MILDNNSNILNFSFNYQNYNEGKIRFYIISIYNSQLQFIEITFQVSVIAKQNN